MGISTLARLLAAVVVAGLLLGDASPGASNHERFLVENSDENVDGTTLGGINWPWIIEAVPFHVCGISELSPDATAGIEAAIQSWEPVLPVGTQFDPSCPGSRILNLISESASGADYCQQPPPPNQGNVVACFEDALVSGGVRGGQYGGMPTIGFNDDDDGYDFSPAGWQATMAHELGHVFGLDEAYCDSPGCTTPSPQATIMTSANTITQQNGRKLVTGSASGSLGPTPLDIADVNALYDHEPVQDVTSANLYSDAVVQFMDTNWAEAEYQVDVSIYDPTTQQSYYITDFTVKTGIAGMGGYPPRLPGAGAPQVRQGFFWNKSDFSALEGNYRFCVNATSAVYGVDPADSECTQEYLYPDDVDGDGYSGVAEQHLPLCNRYGSANFADLDRDDDGDGRPNDGCPDDGAPETGAQCDNAANDDPWDDPLVNDGCGVLGDVSEGGISIGTLHNVGCSYYSWGWPADVYRQGTSQLKVTIQDLTSFIAPTRRLGTSPWQNGYDARWDLEPGKSVLYSSWINILDVTTLFTAPYYPTMPPYDGLTRHLNGPACIIQ
jgi:hypothetical protein